MFTNTRVLTYLRGHENMKLTIESSTLLILRCWVDEDSLIV